MTDMPETAWLAPQRYGKPGARIGTWSDWKVHDTTEYVRGDIHQALIDALKDPVPLLEWGDVDWDRDEYGCQVWRDFTSGLVSMTKCRSYAIYKHSNSKLMWVDGTDTNIRYSTYRGPGNWDADIPWQSSVEDAQRAAQRGFETFVLSKLTPAARAALDSIDEN